MFRLNRSIYSIMHRIINVSFVLYVSAEWLGLYTVLCIELLMHYRAMVIFFWSPVSIYYTFSSFKIKISFIQLWTCTCISIVVLYLKLVNYDRLAFNYVTLSNEFCSYIWPFPRVFIYWTPIAFNIIVFIT